MQDEIDRISNSLLEMESIISYDDSKCCIYRVPDDLLKGNEEFYRPVVISIGPKFYNNEKLDTMQELKRIFMKCFREHPDNACRRFEPYIKYIREKEREIRECYEEKFSLLSSEEFVKMIFLDVSFLIYYFLLDSISGRNTPIPFNVRKLVRLMPLVHRDLFLEENQIPLFVVEDIYYIAFGGVIPSLTFNNLALEYIKNSLRMMKTSIEDASDAKHLVDLWRTSCLDLDERRQMRSTKVHDDYNIYLYYGSAKELSAAGVKFESIKSSNPLDITFDKSKGVLKLPEIRLYASTEATWRSILLFEQCHHELLYFSDYVCFLSQLIDSEEDIKVLEWNGIVVNELGSNEEAAHLFHNITKNLVYSGNFTFSDVCKGLNEYSSMRWNRWKAKYLNHPWAETSVIYAIINLILNVLQAVLGFTSSK